MTHLCDSSSPLPPLYDLPFQQLAGRAPKFYAEKVLKEEK